MKGMGVTVCRGTVIVTNGTEGDRKPDRVPITPDATGSGMSVVAIEVTEDAVVAAAVTERGAVAATTGTVEPKTTAVVAIGEG